MPEFWLRPARASDRELMERLWLLFRHDLSEFLGVLPNPDGTFRNERLQSAFNDPGWAAYLLMLADRPAGFAVVRALNSPVRVLTAFFVVRGVRRTGIGMLGVKAVVAAHPGRWEVAFQDANTGAVRFWRRVATEIAGDAWTEERRPVPGRPDVPPDVWISFSADES
jgi:predicted acetyltransferase